MLANHPSASPRADTPAELAPKIKLPGGLVYSLIGTTAALADMLDKFGDLTGAIPSLYLDLEGVNLSRHGSVSVLQIYVKARDCTYLIDVHMLQQRAFSTVGAKSGKALKGILEDPAIEKVFFDIRRDSDALYAHYGIKLACIDAFS
jgi:exonuclease 3'-5' domain-containing protein 1